MMGARSLPLQWLLALALLPALATRAGAQTTASVDLPKAPAARSGGPLNSWLLEGELLDDEEIVRSFLRPLMQESQNWSQDDQREVSKFLLDLGYHSSILNEELPSGGVRATIELRPVTLVRHVKVEVDAGLLEGFKQPLFADDMARRMTLRPGTALAPDLTQRQQQLQAEAERLRRYLVNDGFYDAKVDVSERANSPFQSRVRVRIKPGPPYFIGNIEVVGNASMETEKVVAFFKHKRLCLVSSLCFFNQRFSRQQLHKDKQKLIDAYQKRGYPGVSVQHDYDVRHSFRRAGHRVDFRVEIRERRRIDVVFEGNSEHHPDDQLFTHLTLTEVASYDDVEVAASANAIRNYYQSQGYFEAQVNWERALFPDFNFERIIFYIDEGPRLRVRSVAFTGNDALSSAKLRDALRTRVYKRLIVGDSGGYATSQQLDDDVSRILAKYRLAGYRDAQVRLEVSRAKSVGGAPSLAAAVASRQHASGLYVTFHIDEGERSSVDEVQIVFRGPHVIEKEELRKKLELDADDSFLEDVAREDGERLRRYYYAHGFPRAQVSTQFQRTGNSSVIVHTVQENSPARIGKIAIRGNFKTRDWVVLDELKLEEGDLLTVALAEQAQSNLRRSGLFSTVQLNFVGRENPRQETVNVLVRVEERHDNLMTGEAGGGYSTDSEGFVEVGGALANLGGIGARLDVRGLVGQKQLLGELKLRLPRWVMRRYTGTDLNLETSGSYIQDETERFGLLTTVGGTLALSKEGRRGFFEGWLLSLRYDFRRRNRNVFLVRPSGNSNDIEETKVTTISSTVGPRLVIDRRTDREGNRNPLTPGAGYRLEFRGLFAEDYVLGSDRFLKLGFAAQKFWSVGSRLVLSTGLRYDHGVPLGGVSLLPEVERFFAGGDTTVRGFEEDHLAVEIIDNPLPPFGGITQFRVVPAGGNIRMIHNLDLQLTVWEWRFPIATALFLDTGLVTNSLVGLSPSDLGFGAGIALARIVLPVGSLSAEYAVPLTVKLGDDPKGRWHFNLGVHF